MEKIKKPSEREQISLRIPTKLKQQLEEEAKQKGCSLNAYIINQLYKEINQE